MPVETLMDEAELVKRLSQGDDAAFRKLFEWYTPRLLKYAWSMTKSRTSAEELVQDCFLKIWTRKETLSEVADFDAYLFIIARNKILDHFRRTATDAKLRSQAWEQLLTVRNDTEETLDASESRQLIMQALDQLSGQKQKIFRMSRFDGLTHDQIADRLGISKNTVKNHLVDTLRHIKSFLRDHTDAVIVFIIMSFLE